MKRICAIAVILGVALLNPLAAFAGEGHDASNTIPLWSVAPFVLMLLAIAILPLAFSHWWESNRNKLIVSMILGLPVAVWLLTATDHGGHHLLHTAKEYVAFIVLLMSLYVIAGGIHLKGSLAGTPLSNTVMLAIGAVIASFIGTTGASMVLIRPILRANESRQRKAHIVIFFIFIVSNIGGCLTPLGDPPLFLGFLRGVDFTWTFNLWVEWAVMIGALLVIFNFFDQHQLNKEEAERPGSQLEEAEKIKVPLAVEGKVNLLLLLGVVSVIFCTGYFGRSMDWSDDAKLVAQVGAMLFLTVVSMAATPKAYRQANKFTWHPIIEVAVLFAGIFATMIPALLILEARGKDLGVTEPWQYFWAAGTLSSFLDNAPTYLTFTSLLSGTMGTDANNLSQLLTSAEGAAGLAAISLGAVFMGANTYIGNGPNFMVKAIAEESGVRMPSFFGYMLYSILILIPLFVLCTLVFFI